MILFVYHFVYRSGASTSPRPFISHDGTVEGLSSVHYLLLTPCDFGSTLLSSELLHPSPQVLGRPQRAWLDATLDAVQEAPVKLIISGSVVFGTPIRNGTVESCSGERVLP